MLHALVYCRELTAFFRDPALAHTCVFSDYITVAPEAPLYHDHEYARLGTRECIILRSLNHFVFAPTDTPDARAAMRRCFVAHVVMHNSDRLETAHVLLFNSDDIAFIFSHVLHPPYRQSTQYTHLAWYWIEYTRRYYPQYLDTVCAHILQPVADWICANDDDPATLVRAEGIHLGVIPELRSLLARLSVSPSVSPAASATMATLAACPRHSPRPDRIRGRLSLYVS